jgi:hypothetical protein
MIVALLIACSSGTVDSSGDTDVVDTEPTGPQCTALTSGEWSGGGSALGMTMGVTLTMDEAACTFTLTDWSMVMGDLPDQGSIDGDAVTMGSSSYWSGCTATVSSATQFSGACDDGASFGFQSGG